MSSCLFSLHRFKSDADVSFHTGLPNYASLISIFELLNPGEDCENIFALGLAQTSQRSFTTLNLTTRKMCWQPRKDAAEKSFFFFNCSYGVAQSTVSSSFIQWINFMYLKFQQTCIWPSKAVVQTNHASWFKGEISHNKSYNRLYGSVLWNAKQFTFKFWTIQFLQESCDIKRTCWNFSKWCNHLCQPTIHRQYFRKGKLLCKIGFCHKHLMMVTQLWLTKGSRFKTFCPWVLPLKGHGHDLWSFPVNFPLSKSIVSFKWNTCNRHMRLTGVLKTVPNDTLELYFLGCISLVVSKFKVSPNCHNPARYF